MTERPGSTWFDRLARWFPAGLIAVAVLIRLPTLTLPLLERHAFRQTQTAYMARIFHTDGIDLLHPQPPVFGPPWQVPFEFGLLWTRHADAIKAASEATAWLTSSGLFEWNFGTLEQRLEPGAWAKALRPSIELTAMGLLPFAAVLTVWFAVRHGQWRFWAWVGIAYAAPLAVFFNLYVVHDYYSAAIAPAAAAIVGCGVAALARVVRPGGGWKAVAASALLTVGAVTFVGNVATHWSYAAPIFGDPPISTAQLDLGAQIAADTRPDQLVAIIAHDWDPALLFYADRRGFMVRGSTFAPGQLERFLAEDYAVYRCPWYGDDAWTCTRITAAPE